MTKPTYHNVRQGSQEWHALKAKIPYSASNASAMLGVSPYKSRAQLLREIATAGESEIYAPVADEGHRTEALARPAAELLCNGGLFPVVVSREVDGITLLASCDGLTMDGQIAFEHKQWNAKDAAEVASGSVPEKHQPQCDQVMMVTGAERVLFAVSDGTTENFESCWYEPNHDLCTAIVAGWKQFDRDLAEYQHVEEAQSAVGVTPASLPALLMDITGAVKESNLADYQQVVSARIQSINTDLRTDQDFADAEKTVKFLKAGEEEVESAKARALAQTHTIDELFRAVDALKEEMRAKRLELERLVKARKEAIRAEIINDAVSALHQHAIEIAETMDSRVKSPDVPAAIRNEVAAAMKGKKTVQSLKDAADQVVTNWKIVINAAADEIRVNLKAFDDLQMSVDAKHLFPDLATLVKKPADDFIASVKSRIADEVERQRRRDAEEAARLEALKAEQAETEQSDGEICAAQTSSTGQPTNNNQATDHVEAGDAPTDAKSPIDRMTPYSARIVGGGHIVIALGSGWPSVQQMTIDQASALRDSLTATIRSLRAKAA